MGAWWRWWWLGGTALVHGTRLARRVNQAPWRASRLVAVVLTSLICSHSASESTRMWLAVGTTQHRTHRTPAPSGTRHERRGTTSTLVAARGTPAPRQQRAGRQRRGCTGGRCLRAVHVCAWDAGRGSLATAAHSALAGALRIAPFLTKRTFRGAAAVHAKESADALHDHKHCEQDAVVDLRRCHAGWPIRQRGQ